MSSSTASTNMPTSNMTLVDFSTDHLRCEQCVVHATVGHDLIKELLQEREALSEERRQLEIEKIKWEELFKKVDESHTQPPIKLNVGGTIFSTNVNSLTSSTAAGSFFDAMFSGRWNIKKCDENSVFIDRDPACFRDILNYLRGVQPNIRNLSKMKKLELKEEAKYYCLTDLVDMLTEKPDIFSPGPNYTVDSSGKRATCISSGSWQCTMLGPEVSPESPRTIRILTNTSSSMMVGLALPTIDQNQKNNFRPGGCGWYFYCGNQTLYSAHTKDSAKSYTGNCKPLPAASTVGVNLDENGVVSFSINGIDQGHAFTVPMNDETMYRLVVLMSSTTLCPNNMSIIELVD